MTHIDLAQAQSFLRQQANSPARKLRRQLTGAALFLLMAGGYGLYHASASPAPQPQSPAASPVTVETLKPQTVKPQTLKPQTGKPFAEFSGRINAPS